MYGENPFFVSWTVCVNHRLEKVVSSTVSSGRAQKAPSTNNKSNNITDLRWRRDSTNHPNGIISFWLAGGNPKHARRIYSYSEQSFEVNYTAYVVYNLGPLGCS